MKYLLRIGDRDSDPQTAIEVLARFDSGDIDGSVGIKVEGSFAEYVRLDKSKLFREFASLRRMTPEQISDWELAREKVISSAPIPHVNNPTFGIATGVRVIGLLSAFIVALIGMAAADDDGNLGIAVAAGAGGIMLVLTVGLSAIVEGIGRARGG